MFASNTSHSGEQLDAQFNYVTMLLPGNGTNGAQNNTFLDASTNNFTITRNGNATQGTFSPYGDLWSNYFDGTGDYLTAPDNAAWDVGSSNWTAEAWVFPTASPNQPIIIGQWTSSYAWAMQLSDDSSRNLRGLVYNGSFTDFSGSTPLTLNAWNHCVFTRDGTTLRLYLNGVQVATNSFGSGSINTSSSVLSIGADGAGSQPFQGYLSNVRFVNGTCLYPNGTTFTPPTSPLTAVTNTKLLTCQSNRFIDNSSNNFTITRNGDVSVQRFSPFSPATAYSAATVGGSGYFDGSGDYLSVAGLGSSYSGDITIEAYCYLTVAFPTAASESLFGPWQTGTQHILLRVDSSSLELFLAGSSIFSVDVSSYFRASSWNHIAVSRSSGTLKAFVNGTQVFSGADSTSINLSSLVIAAERTTGINTWDGYLSSVRISNSARYTAAFTPSSTPFTSDGNTLLLLNYTNAGIIDNAMMNDLETVGNAQISTSVKKYGTGSLAFDGSGDYLRGPSNPDLGFGTGDFTVEFWLYENTTTGFQYILQINDFANGFWVYKNTGSTKLVVGVGSADIITQSSTPSLSTWNHYAIVRSGSTVTLYYNGSADGSATSSASVNGGQVWIGTYNALGLVLNGYIDDLRITKGVARYTANFTPPTAAFPTN